MGAREAGTTIPKIQYHAVSRSAHSALPISMASGDKELTRAYERKASIRNPAPNARDICRSLSVTESHSCGSPISRHTVTHANTNASEPKELNGSTWMLSQNSSPEIRN